jgi:hypothetical protein
MDKTVEEQEQTFGQGSVPEVQLEDLDHYDERRWRSLSKMLNCEWLFRC